MGVEAVAVPSITSTLGANNIVPFIRGAQSVATLATPSSVSSSAGGAVGGGLGGAVLGGVASWITSELIFTRPAADTSLTGLQQRTLHEVKEGDMTSSYARALADAMKKVQQAFPGQTFEVVQGTTPEGTPVLALKRGNTVIPLMEGGGVISRPTAINSTTGGPTTDSSPSPDPKNQAIASQDRLRQEQQAQQQADRVKAQAQENQQRNQALLDKAWSGSSLAHLQEAYGSFKGQFERATKPQIQVTFNDRNGDGYVDNANIESPQAATQRGYEGATQHALRYNQQAKDGTAMVVFRHPKNADVPVVTVFRGSLDEVERLVANGVVSAQDLDAVGIAGRVESRKEKREARQELEQIKKEATATQTSNQRQIDTAWGADSITALEKSYQSFKGQFEKATKPQAGVSIRDRNGDGIGDHALVESAEAAVNRSYQAATAHAFKNNQEVKDGTAMVVFRHKVEGAAVPAVTVYRGSLDDIKRLVNDKLVTQEDLKNAGIEERVKRRDGAEWMPPGQDEPPPSSLPNHDATTEIPREKPPEKVDPIPLPGTGIEIGTDKNETPPPTPDIPPEQPQSPPPVPSKEPPPPAPTPGDGEDLAPTLGDEPSDLPSIGVPAEPPVDTTPTEPPVKPSTITPPTAGQRPLVSFSEGTTPLGRMSRIPAEYTTVSREHAEVTVSNGIANIRDLGSTNGTFVNERNIGSDAVRLSDFDTVTLGQEATAYTFTYVSEATQHQLENNPYYSGRLASKPLSDLLDTRRQIEANLKAEKNDENQQALSKGLQNLYSALLAKYPHELESQGLLSEIRDRYRELLDPNKSSPAQAPTTGGTAGLVLGLNVDPQVSGAGMTVTEIEGSPGSRVVKGTLISGKKFTYYEADPSKGDVPVGRERVAFFNFFSSVRQNEYLVSQLNESVPLKAQGINIDAVTGNAGSRKVIGTLSNGNGFVFDEQNIPASTNIPAGKDRAAVFTALSGLSYEGRRNFAVTLDPSSDFQLIRYEGNDGKVLPEAYREAMERGRRHFDAWLWSDSQPITTESFVSMSNENHRQGNYKLDPELAGEIRQGWARSRRPEASEYTQKIADQLNLGPLSEGELRIDGINKNHLPHNQNTGPLSGTHVYPYPLKSYFERGAELLTEIKEGLQTNRNPEEIQELIGDYLHVMVNARPYHKTNMALFMNQVNYLLNLTGHPGMRQGDLDHLFMRLDSDQARAVWKEALRGNVPDSRSFGITIPY